MPHITLSSSFTCPDARVEELVTDVTDVADNFLQEFRSRRLHLEKYVSPNYLGLFAAQKDESLLRSLSHNLACAATETSNARVDSRAKSFHVTLAYQFPGEHAAGLEDLSAGINPDAIADWELRLYSFEERMLNADVFKVRVHKVVAYVDVRMGQIILVLNAFE
jgi:2'-5' RNA ligase